MTSKESTVENGAQQGAPEKAPGAGPLRFLLPALVGSLLVTAGLTLAVYLTLITGAGQSQLDQFGALKAQQHANQFADVVGVYQAFVNEAANHPLVAAAVANPAGQYPAEQNQLKPLFPGASLIKVYAKGMAKKDPNSTPPISFAQLDMIAKIEKGSVAQPEIQRVDKQLFVTMAAPITGSGQNSNGTLLVAYPLPTVTAQLTPVPVQSGLVEIIQTFSNKESLVFNSGGQQHRGDVSFSAASRVPHWSARYYPADQLNVMQQKTSLLWIMGGLACLLNLLLLLLSYWLLDLALKTNATTLADHIYHHANKQQSNKKFSLKLFAALAATLKGHIKSSAPRATTNATSAETAEAETPTDARAAFEDDDLDLELNEDDHDLLSGAATLEDNPLELDDMDVSEPAQAPTRVTVDPGIFRAYDIRGVLDQNLDSNVARSIGQAVASEAKEQGQKAIIVARDGRLSSPDLAQSLIEGIQAAGCDVIDIGMVPTPVLYYATKTLSTQSGVMVTGSHNPANYNGFKIVIADTTLSKDKIQTLYHRITQGNLTQGSGRYETADINADYLDRICTDVVLARPMRIVVDAGNGVAGPLITQLLDNLGCTVTPLFTEVDGNFPNHHPDPSKPENLSQLQQLVQQEQADVGLAFDGDGDRLGLVLADGRIVWPDRILMLLAKDLLSRTPGADVVYDVKCTRDLAELVSSLGGRAILSATGHSIMKAKMRETGAVVGGELSGHIFFNDRWYGFDDALYSAARLLEILSMEPVSPIEVFDEFPAKHNTPELQINVPDKTKFSIVERLREKGNFAGGNLVNVDGVRVDFPNSWGLLRASNTTPVLVARFEGDTEDALATVKSLFREQLLAIEPGLDIPF